MGHTIVGRVWVFSVVAALALVAVVDRRAAAASQLGFVYALVDVPGGANRIHGFRFDPSTGALIPLAGFPLVSGGTGSGAPFSEQLAYLDGRLYVLNDGDNTLTVFSVNRASGALTAMPFSPVALGAGSWTCVAVHPSGSPVVVGNGNGGIASFVVTATTAVAAPGNPFATGAARPFSCRFSHDGTYIYTGGNLGTTIAGFSVNAGTGVLTALAGSPFESGGNQPLGYATDSDGRVFSSMLTGAQVRAFTTASGIPTGVSGNPFASGITTPTHAVLHPAGFYLVADRGGNRVASYRIAGAGSGTTLTAVVGSPFAAGGTFTDALALAPNGAHAVAANGTSRNLTVFAVNQSTGALTSIGVQAANTLGASGLVTGLAFVQSEAGFLYTLRDVSGGANQFHGFRIDPATGALTLLAGFPIATGGTGAEVTSSEMTAYLNGRLYAVNDGGDTLSAFRGNRTTGALTALPFSPIALDPGTWRCVAVHPSGSPVVVGNSDGTIASFDIAAATATAAAGSPYSAGGALPSSCAFSRDGSYVHAGGNGLTPIAGFSVNAVSGVLTPLAGSPFNSGAMFPAAYATDAAGRLFIADASAQHVRVFTTTNGVPTGVSGNPFASGLFSGFFGVLHPSGYYIVTDIGGFRLGVYQIAGSGAATTLTAVSGSPFGSGGSFPLSLALSEDGAFLVAANGDSRNLAVFRVNPGTGGLTSIGVQPIDTLGATGRITGLAFAPVVPIFTDDPLTALSSVVKAVHVTELRARVDAVRAQFGLTPYAYTDPTLTVATTIVRAVHVTDLRAALAEVYATIGTTPPTYTDPTLTVSTTVVKLAHIAELRAAVVAIE